MSERKFYCLCDSNCKYETMTKEQILAAIAQAAAGGLTFDPDAGIVSKVKEGNAGGYITFWVGTQAQYNALATKDANCFYLITDSTQATDIAASIKAAQDAAADAAALAATPVAIDISGSVILSGITDSTAENITCGSRFKKWKYVPALKAIFFEFQFHYTGTATAGQYIDLNVVCDYKKTSAESIHNALLCTNKKISALYMYDNKIRITFNEDISTTASNLVSISGWYFVD